MTENTYLGSKFHCDWTVTHCKINPWNNSGQNLRLNHIKKDVIEHIKQKGKPFKIVFLPVASRHNQEKMVDSSLDYFSYFYPHIFIIIILKISLYIIFKVTKHSQHILENFF